VAASNTATMFHVALRAILARKFSIHATGACDRTLWRIDDDGLSGGEINSLTSLVCIQEFSTSFCQSCT
jgi:hypothetical protein